MGRPGWYCHRYFCPYLGVTPPAPLSATFIEQLGRDGVKPDVYQQRVLEICASLADDLSQSFGQPREAWSLARLLRVRKTPRNPVRGLYLWGSVGRGKTLILSLIHI